jgi:hypothetical protein
MPSPDFRARITAALHGIEAAEALSSGDLLLEASNAELLEGEERLAHILARVRAEIDNRGLN